jgi:hypothetical protein
MSSLRDIHTKLRTLHAFQKETHASATQFQEKWTQLFETPISHKNAEYFISHYREMYMKKNGGRRTLKRGTYKLKSKSKSKSKTYRKHKRSLKGKRGGSYALTGAPLTYAMTPGMTASIYGKFPTEIGTDPASIQNLDVFYGSALSRGCGIENSTRHVPETMGSNKLGGNRTLRRNRKVGGSLMESIKTIGPIPTYSTVTPNVSQIANTAYAGQAPFPSKDQTDHTWAYSNIINRGINPGAITPITGDFSSLAFSTST